MSKEKLLLVDGLLPCLELGDNYRSKLIEQHDVEEALKKKIADYRQCVNSLQRSI
ncbi:hypothetical protein [Methylomonas rosea]|uniref:Uncharacterized protein n=1 Tax=Methylomonas rosea TaxID=2952227 RepID=A0ABT1TXK1_9GAMM|nr:hypothetical protein [Methylomonas sp. WSC-7]MCQ8119495.1 hypothetical protein [Methylomonas sp. WSC-7]